MALKIRRVITGHDAQGKAQVDIDDISPHITVNRANIEICNLWTSAFPSSNTEEGDCAEQIRGTTRPGGSLFRIIEFQPGVEHRIHRTDTLDYIVVLSGEIDMELEEGRSVHLKAGEVMVQRGTVHNWVNNGSESCVCAFVIIDAEPVTIGGRTLQAFG